MSKSLTFALSLLLLAPAANAQNRRQQNPGGFKASESSAPFAPKACFDYTRLQEPEAVWFERLSAVKLDLPAAIETAVGGDENVRATGARLEIKPRPYYLIELMRNGSETFQTVRLDPNTGAPIEETFEGEACFNHGDFPLAELNAALFESLVTLEIAAAFSTEKYNHGAFAREATFIGQGEDRRHELEVFSKHKNGQNRRWHIVVPAKRAMLRMRLMQAQWAGEPLDPADSPVSLESGLMIHDFIIGDGELVEPDSVITAHYRLVLLDNQAIFNSKLAKPVTFRISEAQLEGLKLGVEGMRVGGKRKIIMPAEFAFGSRGRGNIPGNAIVVADIGVLSIVDEGE